MTTLTTTQQAVIDGARDNADGSIYPLPPNLKGGAALKVVAALKAKGLIDDNGILATRSRTITALERADEPPAHGPGPDFSDDAVAQAWSDNMPEADKAYHEEMNAASEEPDGPDDSDDPPIGIIVPMDPALCQTSALDNDDQPVVAGTPEAATECDTGEQPIDQATALANDDEPATPYMAIKVMGLHFGLESEQFKGIVDECLAIAFRQGCDSVKQVKKTKPVRQTTSEKVVKPRSDTKQAKIIAMLRRPDGATVDQIMAETGWQIHTARGFISLLKTRHGIETRKEGKTYFAPAAA